MSDGRLPTAIVGANGTPGGPSSTPRSPRRVRRAWWKAVLAAAVAAGIVAALLGTGVIPWGRSTANGSVAFLRADSKSLAAVAQALGGSWSVLGAVGFDERTAEDLSVSNVSRLVGANCTLAALPGGTLPAALVVPSFPGSFGSGLAPMWIVFVTDLGAGSVVAVEVLDGSAVLLGQIDGTHCPSGSLGGHPLPATTVDSPVVAGTAWNEMGSSWVKADPSLTSLTMAAFGAGSYAGVAEPGVWGIVYSPCNPLLGGSTPQTAFLAVFNLTTGGLTDSFSHGLDCPP